MTGTSLHAPRPPRPANTISWWEPRWSHQPRFVADMTRAGTLRARFWIRILAVSIIVAGALIVACFLAFPGMYIPYWHMAGAIVAIPLYLAAWHAIAYFLPPHITIKPSAVIIQHGGHAFAILRKNIHSATLDASDPLRIVLTLDYTTNRKRERTKAIGVAERINLAALADLLGKTLQDAAAPPP